MITGHHTSAVADPNKIVWINPEAVRFKVVGSKEFKSALAGVVPGDWDLDREAIADTPKYRSIVEHYAEGVAWEDTELFSDYAERLARGEIVRGCGNIAELKRVYDVDMDGIFDQLKRDGFRPPDPRDSSLAHVHIGRDGEILFGRAGNHRFAMARVLRLEFFPCTVRARHENWQKIRDQVFGLSGRKAEDLLGRDLAAHPDLSDVIMQGNRGRLSLLAESLRQRFRRGVFGRTDGSARRPGSAS